MNSKVKNGFLLVVMLFLTVCVYAQDSSEIMKYLESTVEHNYRYIDNPAFSEVSSLELIEVRLDLNFNNDEYGSSSISSYLIKNESEFIKIPSLGSLIEMPEFYQSIRKDFKLKTPEDGLVFQTALGVISDDERNEGFFNVDTKWYFIRSEFFGRYYIVQTDTDGSILSVKYSKGIESDIPEEVHYSNERKSYQNQEISEIDENTREQISTSLKKYIEYKFEIEDKESENFKKVSAAKLYNATFTIIEINGDEKYESSYCVDLMTYDGKIFSSTKIWVTDLFIESTTPVFKLKKDTDAELFQNFLNEMESNSSNVRFYQKDDLWLFVRDDSFGEENGYIVKTNKEGNITQIAHSNFSESDILRFRMQDPDFKVDYGFLLKSPTETTFRYDQDELIIAEERGEVEYIEVVIEFNEQAVNAVGAWIMTRFNGQNYGVLASSNMESPFTDNIPVISLPKGNNKIEYLLLPPGEETDKTFGSVEFEIIIE
ncbi:MAG: hypothetical protein PHR06_06930 [Candidatus Cloacimonetes bacterium]|nr:hypothetical protein [Candidatus Cloacimonadota bacterium]